MAALRGRPTHCPFCTTPYRPPAVLCRGCQADIIEGSTLNDGAQFAIPALGLIATAWLVYMARAVLAGNGALLFDLGPRLAETAPQAAIAAVVIGGACFYWGYSRRSGMLRFVHPKKGTQRYIL